ncbi:SRPBCC domain-containing protein [Alteromonas sp. ASW11-36]|uniref:SRPBCC domain-containing protein n=1 Tax=Alteromonas arenosi TaxID=3055817 RepID=A0ABT7STR7_9ALTE|nr:SRPBCC domain-containing protein [Alteromonas sp. ASW11-36]MDM7859583.1 SRPBCC domain-containing protein [Alteromonas sp. ASW11-36]
MTTNEMRKSIYKVFINASIDKVWSEIVNTDSPRQFFFNGQCDTPGLAVGAPMAMRTPDGKYTSVVGEVTEFDPPNRYAHTFKFTHLEDALGKVTYNLEAKHGGTEFTLISENPATAEVSKTEKSMQSGSKFICENLKALVETGKPTFSGRLILGIIKLTQGLSPKSAASENWTFQRITELHRKEA